MLYLQQEEHDYGPIETPHGVRAYLTSYKSFSEPFTNVLKAASADDVDIDCCKNMEKMAGSLVEQIHLYVCLHVIAALYHVGF